MMKKLVEDLEMEKTRYINWVNSLSLAGVEEMESLDGTLDDGVILLKILELISPESVDWNKVNLPAKNKFKQMGNCNYALNTAKQLGIPVQSIDGKDILDRKYNYILAVLWLFMREHYYVLFGEQEEEVVEQWANQFLEKKEPIVGEDPDYEPLMIILYFGADGEVFMGFSDEKDEILCDLFPNSLENWRREILKEEIVCSFSRGIENHKVNNSQSKSKKNLESSIKESEDLPCEPDLTSFKELLGWKPLPAVVNELDSLNSFPDVHVANMRPCEPLEQASPMPPITNEQKFNLKNKLKEKIEIEKSNQPSCQDDYSLFEILVKESWRDKELKDKDRELEKKRQEEKDLEEKKKKLIKENEELQKKKEKLLESLKQSTPVSNYSNFQPLLQSSGPTLKMNYQGGAYTEISPSQTPGSLRMLKSGIGIFGSPQDMIDSLTIKRSNSEIKEIDQNPNTSLDTVKLPSNSSFKRSWISEGIQKVEIVKEELQFDNWDEEEDKANSNSRYEEQEGNIFQNSKIFSDEFSQKEEEEKEYSKAAELQTSFSVYSSRSGGSMRAEKLPDMRGRLTLYELLYSTKLSEYKETLAICLQMEYFSRFKVGRSPTLPYYLRLGANRSRELNLSFLKINKYFLRKFKRSDKIPSYIKRSKKGPGGPKVDFEKLAAWKELDVYSTQLVNQFQAQDNIEKRKSILSLLREYQKSCGGVKLKLLVKRLEISLNRGNSMNFYYKKEKLEIKENKTKEVKKYLPQNFKNMDMDKIKKYYKKVLLNRMSDVKKEEDKFKVGEIFRDYIERSGEQI